MHMKRLLELFKARQLSDDEFCSIVNQNYVVVFTAGVLIGVGLFVLFHSILEHLK